MAHERQELLVTITFRIPHATPHTVADKLEPVMRSAIAVGGKTAHIDISFYEEPGKDATT
jgi:hypothetical protein